MAACSRRDAHTVIIGTARSAWIAASSQHALPPLPSPTDQPFNLVSTTDGDVQLMPPIASATVGIGVTVGVPFSAVAFSAAFFGRAAFVVATAAGGGEDVGVARTIVAGDCCCGCDCVCGTTAFSAC